MIHFHAHNINKSKSKHEHCSTVDSDISFYLGNCVDLVSHLILSFFSGKRLGRAIDEDSPRSLPASSRATGYHD